MGIKNSYTLFGSEQLLEFSAQISAFRFFFYFYNTSTPNKNPEKNKKKSEKSEKIRKNLENPKNLKKYKFFFEDLKSVHPIFGGSEQPLGH